MTFDMFLFALRPRDTTKKHCHQLWTKPWTCSRACGIKSKWLSTDWSV